MGVADVIGAHDDTFDNDKVINLIHTIAKTLLSLPLASPGERWERET